MHGFEQVVVGEAGASRSRAAHQRRELISCARAMIIAARRPGCHFGSCSGRTGSCTPGLAAVEPGISLVGASNALVAGLMRGRSSGAVWQAAQRSHQRDGVHSPNLAADHIKKRYTKDTGSKNRRPLMNRKLIRPDGPSNCNLTNFSRYAQSACINLGEGCKLFICGCCIILIHSNAHWGVPCFGLLRAAPGQTA
jgi:hypothetical protein